jgi:hypothetical protein
MPIRIHDLLSGPVPSLVIFDDTYDAEVEIRRILEKEILPNVKFSSVDESPEVPPTRMRIALESITLLLAEKISQQASEQTGAIHLRKEHLSQAIHEIATRILGHPVEIEMITDWHASVTRFLRAQLRSIPKREAIFQTCERFKIDLADFSKLFPRLPT